MSSLATNDVEYSVLYAQQLGDDYKRRSLQKEDTRAQYFLSAKLCYSLVTKTGNINDHEINLRDRGSIDRSKLSQLQQFQMQYNIRINQDKQEACPREVLSLLKSFYSPWLRVAKCNLKARCQSHIEIRHNAFIQVYDQMTHLYHNIFHNDRDGFISNLERIRHQMLQQQHDYIDNEWNGPDFRHLQYQKLKGEYLDELTAVYDKKGYLKRCNNSQEDWLRKYHGEFLAKCILKAKRVFDADLKMKLHFGELLLNKKVRFNSSRDTDLIPGGWIFGPSCDSMANALKQLLEINIKNIKQTGGRCKSHLREILLNELSAKRQQLEHQRSNGASITPPPRPPPPNTHCNYDTSIRMDYGQRQANTMNNPLNLRDQVTNLTQENRQLRDELAMVRQRLYDQSRQSQMSISDNTSSSFDSAPATPTPTPSVHSADSTPTQMTRVSVPMPPNCNSHPPPNPPPRQMPSFPPSNMHHVPVPVPFPNAVNIAPVVMQPMQPMQHMKRTIIIPQRPMEASYVNHNGVYGHGGHGLSEANGYTVRPNTDNNVPVYVPCESSSISPQQSIRHKPNKARTDRSRRDFQHIDPRNYSIRKDMRQSLRIRDKRERSYNRESCITFMKNMRNHNAVPYSINIHHNNQMLSPAVNVNNGRGLNNMSQFQPCAVSQRRNPYFNPLSNPSGDNNDNNNGYMEQQQVMDSSQMNEARGQITTTTREYDYVPATPCIPPDAESLIANNGVIQSSQPRVHLNSLFN